MTCSRSMSPTTSAPRSIISASSAAMSASAGMVINKDDGTGEAAGIRRCCRHPDPCPLFRPTTTSGARARTTKSSASLAGGGRRSSNNLPNKVAWRPPVRPTPLTQDALLGLFAGDAVGRDVVLDRRRWTTCAAATMLSRSRRSKSIYEGDAP